MWEGSVAGAEAPSQPEELFMPHYVYWLVCGTIAIFAILVLLIVSVLFFVCFRRLKQPTQDAEELSTQGTYPVRFSMHEIIDGTKKFDRSVLIKKGRFSSYYVYRKPDMNDMVIRRLHRNIVQNRSADDFESAVKKVAVGAIHPNLVKLIGFSTATKERVIVFERISMGSLHEHLHGNSKKPLDLDWKCRVQVALGVARGLNHLHQRVPPLPHGMLDSTRVLLDANGTAKLSGYGEQLLIPEEASQKILIHSIKMSGYSAPEQIVRGHGPLQPSDSSADVYAFGVLLLELLTGRKALDTSRGSHESLLADFFKPMLNDTQTLLTYIDPRMQVRVP
ncbi:hypothetical protein CLOM_g23276 [Closterium sp. NIES-68]|nr:hypothetical protein CLOM_g23276 [Closterium sp. NIES-68]GJP80190.1 hypothetical protein CLOP_g10423 [Closterium sp. NIES-67]